MLDVGNKQNLSKAARANPYINRNHKSTQVNDKQGQPQFSPVVQQSSNHHYSQSTSNSQTSYDNTPLISMSNKTLLAVPLTREIFLETYSKGKWNLSVVPCPSCFTETTLLKPPEAYNEAKRLKAVESYISLPHWKNNKRLSTLLNKTMKMFDCNGASISLIDARNQIVKQGHNLGFKECDRNISIDSHTILSTGFFALLDASSDWRTEGNPLVKGPPTIRYYVSVPLLTSTKDAIGAVSIFDSIPRKKIEENTVTILQQIASEIMEYLDTVYATPNATSMIRSALPGSNISSGELLLKEYGRATSTDKASSVFEIDGSGNRYQQDGHIRFSKYSPPYGDMVDLGVWKTLLNCMNGKSASTLLSRILAEKLSFNCVYIMNIRATELFKVKSSLFPKENEIESETYKFKSSMESSGEENINLKLLGIEGLPENSNLATFQPHFHYKAFKSDFGIIYKSKDTKVKFRSGICMPFHRRPTRLVRKKKINNKNGTNGRDSNETIEVYHRSGGFLVSCFNIGERELTEKEIGYIYSCVSILRRLYFMQ